MRYDIVLQSNLQEALVMRGWTPRDRQFLGGHPARLDGRQPSIELPDVPHIGDLGDL